MMTDSTVITARVSGEVSALLDRLAGELDRSRAWVIATAVERYAREELEFIDFIKKGEDDIAAGRVYTQAEVEAMFEVKRAKRNAA